MAESLADSLLPRHGRAGRTHWHSPPTAPTPSLDHVVDDARSLQAEEMDLYARHRAGGDWRKR